MTDPTSQAEPFKPPFHIHAHFSNVVCDATGASAFTCTNWEKAQFLTDRLNSASPAAGDWAMVPRVEMTDAMMDAGQHYLNERSLSLSAHFNLPGTFNWHDFWRAMLAAAPQPPSGEREALREINEIAYRKTHGVGTFKTSKEWKRVEMTDLTLEEKTRGAENRAREQVAEKHFYDLAQPFFPLGFSVVYRNPGHWDIYAKQCPGYKAAWEAAHPDGHLTQSGSERAFRIRGEPGDVVVADERWNPHKPHPRESMKFRSALAAMLWIVEELMQEPHP